MPRGVHVFEVVADKHIDELWVRDVVLGVSRFRYRKLKQGLVLFTREEANRIVEAFKEVYGIEGHELFDWDAEILPPNRRRRAKGTLTQKGSAA